MSTCLFAIFIDDIEVKFQTPKTLLQFRIYLHKHILVYAYEHFCIFFLV